MRDSAPFGTSATPRSPASPDDGALVAAWLERRDERAFAELAVRLAPLMRRVARAVAGPAVRADLALADDIVQESLVRLVGALGRWRGAAPLPAFVAGVVRKTALGELRALARRRAREGERWAPEAGAAPETPGRDRFRGDSDAGTGDPARDYERSASAERALAILWSFGEPARTVLYLRDAEGFSYAEIAEATGLPEGTVKSALARARERLKREFGEGS